MIQNNRGRLFSWQENVDTIWAGMIVKYMNSARVYFKTIEDIEDSLP